MKVGTDGAHDVLGPAPVLERARERLLVGSRPDRSPEVSETTLWVSFSSWLPVAFGR